MGIHLPFVGYVKPRGALTVRNDRTRPANNRHVTAIKEFFAALTAFPFENLKPFLPNPSRVSEKGNFEEILFETDEYNRPVLKMFIERPRPKSLIISTKEDLFEVENEVVDRFAFEAVQKYIPILCVHDDKCPLSPAFVRTAGNDLPFLLMDNQKSVQETIENRFAQLDGKRSQKRRLPR